MAERRDIKVSTLLGVLLFVVFFFQWGPRIAQWIGLGPACDQETVAIFHLSHGWLCLNGYDPAGRAALKDSEA